VNLIKPLVWVLSGILLYFLLSLPTAEGQLPPSGNPRDALSGEFVGLETSFVYMDDNGVVQVEDIKTKLGRLFRGIRAFEISSIGGVDPAAIPTAQLAAEHWWLSFEMLMLAQRDYAECLGAIKEHELRLGYTCLVDQPCSPHNVMIKVLRDYWVPFNIVYDVGIPTRLDYVAHFEAGISGVNLILPHIGSCNSYLEFIRGL
jgi:hypothetical protein